MRNLRIPESAIERAITDLLQLDGWRVFHFEQIHSEERRRTFGEEGMPDMLCLRYPGEIFWAEVKATGGRVSAAQYLWHAAERERGALTIIMGIDCPATIDGWMDWYRGSGMNRGKV